MVHGGGNGFRGNLKSCHPTSWINRVENINLQHFRGTTMQRRFKLNIGQWVIFQE